MVGRHAGDVDDTPVALLQLHLNGGLAAEVERAVQVRTQHGLPSRVVHADEQPILNDAGVIHQDVESAPFRDDARRNRLRRFGIGNVALPRFRGPAGGGNFLFEFLRGGLRPAIDERDLRPFADEGQHDRLPDAATAAGHQGHLILQRHRRSNIAPGLPGVLCVVRPKTPGKPGAISVFRPTRP